MKVLFFYLKKFLNTYPYAWAAVHSYYASEAVIVYLRHHNKKRAHVLLFILAISTLWTSLVLAGFVFGEQIISQNSDRFLNFFINSSGLFSVLWSICLTIIVFACGFVAGGVFLPGIAIRVFGAGVVAVLFNSGYWFFLVCYYLGESVRLTLIVKFVYKYNIRSVKRVRVVFRRFGRFLLKKIQYLKLVSNP